jgi:Zn-dependent protease with chaperone function
MAPSLLTIAPRRPLLWLCGLTTVLLVVFAYLLALAMAVGLGFLAFAVLRIGNLPGLLISLGAGTCSASILWSLAPRRDRFQPPGPALDPAAQPRLFQEIAAIAHRFSEPMPSAVYLMLDSNAWVAQRGGMLGVGGRRVMALGFPLLSVLTVSEFRAVVAHEFAHYYGGDTGFGPWTQKAREALAGSLQRLTSDSGFLNVLSRWAYVALLRLIVVYTLGLYWKLFLWLTLLVSRQWEYRADELASATAGAKPLLEGLRKIACASLAWTPYWATEAAPTLNAGFHPPIAEGFSRFLAAPEVSRQLEKPVAEHLAQETPAPLDTHPTFGQRSQRALAHPFAQIAQDHAPVLSLLNDVPALEQSLLTAILPDTPADSLKPIDWESLGGTVYIPNWREGVALYRDVLALYSVGTIPDALANLPAIAAKVRDPEGMLLTREQRADRAAALFWMAFQLALLDHGWQLHTVPGALYFERGADRLEPANLVRRMRQGILSREGYVDLVQYLGVAELPLAPAEECG